MDGSAKVEVPQAKLGNGLVVEVRNFDGWLANEIDNGFLQDDPLLRKASPELTALITAKLFSIATIAGGEAIQTISDDPQKTDLDIVRKLQQQALVKKKQRGLAALHFPKFQTLQSLKGKTLEKPGSSEDAKKLADETAAEAADDKSAKTFLDPCREANSLLRELVKKRIRALILTINDIPLGVTPDNADYTPISESQRPAQDPDNDTYHWLSFSLAPKAAGAANEEGKANDAPFKRLMAHPSFAMPSKVTLTLMDGSETLTLPTGVTKEAKDRRCQFALIGIERWKFRSMVGLFVLIIGWLVFLGARTDIFRDPCRRRPEGVEPVSLARTQMGFWFVVIAAAFAFLWVTTGNIDTINGTCLTLLAIGTSTALTAVAIQKGLGNRKNDLSDVLGKTPHEMLEMTPGQVKEAIQIRKTELQQSGAGKMTPEELAEARAILENQEKDVSDFLGKKPRWLQHRIYCWWYRLRTIKEDLLTQEAGTYDFHRFQMLAWTLVLGVIFIAKVLQERTMPQFDSNLLLLMGISSGAYIGFKVAARVTDDEKAKEDKKEEDKKDAEAKKSVQGATDGPQA